MEQITDPRTLIDTAEAKVTSPLANHDPSRIWARLNHVALNHRALARNGVISDSNDPQCIPYERLAARLARHVSAQGAIRIGLTSATPGCGTSQLAANLALAFAGQSHLRTMLFDFDLRAPALIHMFDLERIGPKFSALAANRRRFDSTALRLTEGLALSLNATPEADPASRLTAPATQSLLDDIQSDFAPHVMLFDLPALFPLPDALMALNLMDGAFIVAQAGHTTASQVDAAERAIREHCTCFGALLTDCVFADPMTPATTVAQHG